MSILIINVIQLDNHGTEDKQLSITELKDNNEVDDEN
jgi:hypothetical protein